MKLKREAQQAKKVEVEPSPQKLEEQKRINKQLWAKAIKERAEQRKVQRRLEWDRSAKNMSVIEKVPLY